MSTLHQEEQLLQWSGYERSGDLRKWLDRNGISYILGKDGRVCVRDEDFPKEPENQEFTFSGQNTEPGKQMAAGGRA